MCQKVYALSICCILLLGLVSSHSYAPDLDLFQSENTTAQQVWVDSVFNNLTFEERLGQLFMVAAYSNKGKDHQEEISQLIQRENLGGLIFFQGGPVRQAHLTNEYQKLAKTPLFIAMDAEWGLGMRLDSVLRFPKQMTLGAAKDEVLVYHMGREIARQFQEMGMHINFAPVVDVNSDPDNPVIGYRSFGEEKQLVSRKSLAYMQGLQDHGIIANAKHFPGHGNTNSDSHYTTPVIMSSKEKIVDIDLYPYREMIDKGLMSVMVAHLHIPSLGSEDKLPTTLSPKVVTGLLREEMNFQGLIFTDALNMKGVSDLYKPGEVDLLALLAGNDILLYAEDVPKSKKLILEAVEQGKISKEEIDQRVRKVLNAKYWAGLHRPQQINPQKLVERLSNFGTKALIEQLYASSITVLNNQDEAIPVRHLDMGQMASLTLGGKGETFKSFLDKYAAFTHYTLRTNSNRDNYAAMEANLKDYNTIVVGVMGMTNNSRRNFGLNEEEIAFINRLQETHQVITVVFGNAYSAAKFREQKNLVLVYEENEFTESLAPQVIFGGRPGTGKLPISLDQGWALGHGIQTATLDRLAYSTPEAQNMDSRELLKIDRLMEKAIADKATPGGTVLVAKNGSVVLEKSYGHYDYSKSQAVTENTLYDLASLTKVMATTQAIMFLEGRGFIDLDEKLETYLPELAGSNKADIRIRDILTHEAGLLPYIPHFTQTLEGSEWKREYYSRNNQPPFTLPVADGVFAHHSLPDSLWKWTVDSDLRYKGSKSRGYSYRYSDVGMYILHRLIETMVNQPMNEFLEQQFYSPLGMNHFGFLPLQKFDQSQIAPTEDDRLFRKTLVQGYVHDPGAALYGGVAGHAGLFGTANDLAKLMQMMLQGGKYGAVEILDQETIDKFTSKQSFQSRRALGWDKPDPEKDKGPTGNLAPPGTFGHTGFTGTAAWADPENQLIYIFLSNRVHPDAGNNRLLRDNVRSDIQDIVYKSLKTQILLAEK
ncbi:glycoside hydrolase family 3 N-terminal domain-containing protein [Cyclobacterium sp.]|uniref:glycoside hydrolase family 3 N-terminal domain-containing protein n=1 Tax=Cyclobacterium sp. TaxID=1966343 RepID=UPI00198A3234|nr:glycoside hydrolase family 3 N-terminal domain-containing protein [Cyclobacterium sp.]MBD3628727.1 serine hydrolase [Cyclobacterium sp.]